MGNDITNLSGLLEYVDQARVQMEQTVQDADPTIEIYPGWTIREVVINIASWEIVIDKALTAYISSDPPYFLHEQDFDVFNQEAVEVRTALTLEQVLQEWKDVRAALRKTILKLKESDLTEEMVLPWGSERSVAELIEIIGEHDFEHMEDVLRVIS